jgi:anti-sigma-K factor RskA
MSPEDRDRLAVEHIIGLLEGEERREAERLAESDGDFQQLLARWRSRFAELDETVTPQPAGEALWQRIEVSLDEAHTTEHAVTPEASARAAPLLVPHPASAFTALWRNLAFWRAAGLAMAAATFALAVGLAATLLRPVERPVLVAVLLTDDNRPAAVVNAFADGNADLIPLAPIDVPPDRALQVWTLWDRSRGPVSVGLIDRARTVRLRLQDLPRTAPDQLFEISVEPRTGSPTGRPTGPVLMKGLTSSAL